MIESGGNLETLYAIVKNTWELFQLDFEGDPDLEFSSDNLGYGYCEATPTTFRIRFMNEKNKPEYAYEMKK